MMPLHIFWRLRQVFIVAAKCFETSQLRIGFTQTTSAKSVNGFSFANVALFMPFYWCGQDVIAMMIVTVIVIVLVFVTVVVNDTDDHDEDCGHVLSIQNKNASERFGSFIGDNAFPQ